MIRSVCIHGHFYQPPRENPWLEEVELQDSAYPYHDWNEKITAQCYAPNAAARILNQEQKIIRIINNYARMSFNFGPTLLSWLERHRPETYEALIESDRQSRARFSGHGSALAQVFNHMIMPLANTRDKYTQVIWGIEDFRKRFDRDPEGMWLPETAVDVASLEIMAEYGILFTILAPRQARQRKKIAGETDWLKVEDGGIDPSTAYLCRLPSGRSISVFFYDGPISQEIAFSDLLSNGQAFAERLIDAFDDTREHPQLVHVAVDGETFGHHQRHGDMALAYCLDFIESGDLVRLTNYGEFLALNPPDHEVEVIENSSWSCIHGIERWQANCGCHSGMHSGWTQAWRQPLRQALDWLRDASAATFVQHGSRLLKSPWDARNRYIEILADRSPENVEKYLAAQAAAHLSQEEKVKVFRLLEMQRNAMLMYTSCGWFFDDISGTEAVQILQYAARVAQIMEFLTEFPAEKQLVERLAAAPSNLFGDGAKVYEMSVKTARLDLLRVGIHFAVSSLFEDYDDEAEIYCYQINKKDLEILEAGTLRLVLGRIRVSSKITLSEVEMTFAVLHLGGHNINAGARVFEGEEAYGLMKNELVSSFPRSDILEIIRLMDKHFGTNSLSLWHLFRDEQRKIINQILAMTFDDYEAMYRRVFENSQPVMNFLRELAIPLPKMFIVAAERIVSLDLRRLFEADVMDHDRLDSLITVSKRFQLELDRDLLGFKAGAWINALMERLLLNPDNTALMEETSQTLSQLKAANIPLDLWKAQNLYFALREGENPLKREPPELDAQALKGWGQSFAGLGSQLDIAMP